MRHGVLKRGGIAAEEPVGDVALAPSEALPAMHMQPPGFLRGLLTVVRFEVRLLLLHPAVYLFVPFVVLQAIGTTELAEGAFNTPLLLTPGTLAMGLMNTLTLLVSLLLLFFAVDALERERSTALAPIFYSAGVPTSSILFGKILATAALGAHSARDVGSLRRAAAGPGQRADGVGPVRPGLGPHAHSDIHRLVGTGRVAERRNTEPI